MAHAYTPGLKVTERTVVRKQRRLPLKGEVLAKVGDKVTAETIVARTQIPGEVQTLNVAGLLGLPPEDVEKCMLKKVGDPVEKNEIIAQTKSFFGLFSSTVKAPVSGSVESISSVTGQVILREPPRPIQIDAYIDGRVVELFEAEGCAVETTGVFIQGIFGIGGETRGEVLQVANRPSDVLSPEEIDSSCRGKVLVAGALVTAEALRKAAEVGAKGVVVGGIADRDLREFLGYDIGVAITGSEEKGITLIITEGFGRMQMAEKTFRLLVGHSGQRASINGATQIRAGVMRPEVIIPLDSEAAGVEGYQESGGLEIGTPVRIIREPYFGALGKVIALPPELHKIETEAEVRVVEVELEDGARVILPRANVEMIEI